MHHWGRAICHTLYPALVVVSPLLVQEPSVDSDWFPAFGETMFNSMDSDPIKCQPFCLGLVEGSGSAKVLFACNVVSP